MLEKDIERLHKKACGFPYVLFRACLAVSRALTTADHTEPVYEFNPEQIMQDINKYAQNLVRSCSWLTSCDCSSLFLVDVLDIFGELVWFLDKAAL